MNSAWKLLKEPSNSDTSSATLVSCSLRGHGGELPHGPIFLLDIEFQKGLRLSGQQPSCGPRLRNVAGPSHHLR